MATRTGRKKKPARPAESEEATRLADLRIGYDMVGDTYGSRLAWVVDFVRQEPTKWHSTARAANGDALLVLGLPWGKSQVAFADGTLPAPLPAEDVDAIHEAVRGLLTAAASARPGERVRVSKGGTEYLVRATAVGVKPAIWGTSTDDDDIATAVLRCVRNLILQAGGPLIRCPTCGRPFLAFRKAMFCTMQCAQRKRTQRHAAKKKARAR